VLKKIDGTDRAPSKAGRLNLEDMEFLYGIIDEVKEELENRIKPE